MFRSFALLLLLLPLSLRTAAQLHTSDTLFFAKAKDYAQNLYQQSTGSQSGLFNGSAYAEYQPLKDEHPYLLADWMDGLICYNGEVYPKVPLLYDLQTDKVITEHARSFSKIQLIDEKVNYFILGDRKFVRLTDAGITRGLYEVVYDGSTGIYVKSRKEQQERHTVTGLIRTFEEKKTYFIFKRGTFYSVRSKKSVLAVLADKKSELKKFLGQNHLSFSKDRIRSLRLLAQQYDQLNTP